jgi:hypothetical protein
VGQFDSDGTSRFGAGWLTGKPQVFNDGCGQLFKRKLQRLTAGSIREFIVWQRGQLQFDVELFRWITEY